MPQTVIKSVHGWEKESEQEEHRHKMVLLDKNRGSYDWDNSDLGYDAGTTEVSPSPLHELPDKLSGINLEKDNNDTSVVTPEIYQSNKECINEATTNSVLILEGNNRRSAREVTLVDATPLGGGNHIEVPQECVPPKIEELGYPNV